MNKQTSKSGFSRLRIWCWMGCLGVALLPLAFEIRAADALKADAVAMGGSDLLAVLSDSGGRMVSMGNSLSPEPALIVGLESVVKSDGGTGMKAALKSDGTVWSLTQVGAQLVAEQIQGLDRIRDLATSLSHFAALREDGTVWTWGWGQFGQLGNGSTSDSATPVQVQDIADAIAIGAGAGDTYVVRRDGTLWGCGSLSSASKPFVARIQGIENAVAVSASAHALVLKSDGTVMAFGQNKYGQLGDGTRIDKAAPVAVVGLINVMAVSAGNYHSLALKSDGVWAWGSNQHSECGVPARLPDPNSFLFYEPLPVRANISDVIAIDAGRFVSAALKSDRTVWIWGRSVSTTYSDLKVPTQVFYGAGGNHPPTVVSAAWAESSTVTLPGGATTVHVVALDPDGDVLSYAWSQVSGAGTATFKTPAAPDSDVAFSAAGSYTLRVTINDGNGGSVSSEVTVTVLAGGSSGAGDLNGDGIVNITDLLIVVDNWGKTRTDAGYDTRADADGNGLVNIQDLMVVALNFGKDY